ncbi:2'-5' RNA ligase family protein [Streptomyces sp. NPDC049813]|uniref:2'-5' RNA ligase family protein n=1 Tax=Streptomyces sp. NPDC049813 TaxID=3365597 RepID=UPI0037B6078F
MPTTPTTPAPPDTAATSAGSGAGGWPDAPGDTALTIHVPEADALVRTGARAHVTVLYPFLPLARVTGRTAADLRAIIAAVPAFTCAFAELRRWPGVLYLHPSPADPFRMLTKALRERWPEAVPYRGVFGDEALDPHLTLAAGAGTDALPSTAFTRHLPLRAEIRSVRLIATAGRGEGWRDVTEYPLRGGAQAAP